MKARTPNDRLSVVGIGVGIGVGVGVGANVCRRIQMKTSANRCKHLQTNVCKKKAGKTGRSYRVTWPKRGLEGASKALNDAKNGLGVDEMSKTAGTQAASPKRASRRAG